MAVISLDPGLTYYFRSGRWIPINEWLRNRLVRLLKHTSSNQDYYTLSEANFDTQADLAVQEQYNWLSNEEVPNYQNQVPEEAIELEEINLGSEAVESTPLLGGEAGVVSGGAASAAPGIGTIGAGVGVGIGTAVIGGAIAYGTRDGFVLPGHKNIGPGNVPDPEGVDVDDEIAYRHDLAYERAKTQADVSEADRVAIDEFDRDWQATGNIHSAIGRAGIGIKKAVEDRTGVLYPSGLPSDPVSPSVAGMPRAVKSKAYPPNTAGYARQSLGQKKYTWAQWNLSRFNRNQPLVWPNDIPSTTMRSRISRNIPPGYPIITARQYESDPTRYNNQQVERPPAGNGPLVDAFNTQRERNQVNVVDPNDDPGIYNNLDEFDRLAKEYEQGQANVNSPVAGPSRQNLPEDIENLPDFRNTPDSSPPEQVERPAKRRRPNTSAPDEGAFGAEDMSQGTRSRANRPVPMETATTTVAGVDGKANGVSDGGFDSTEGPEMLIQQPRYRASGGNMSYTKVHRINSFAIPYSTIVNSGNKWTVTPLVEIPWNMPYLYLTPEEFALIQGIEGCNIVKCKIHIQHLSAATQFTTGSTEVQISSTSNSKIGVYAMDLEKKMRGGRTLRCTFDANLKATAVTDPTRIDFHNQQYGVDQSQLGWDNSLAGEALGIPYYTRDHFCIRQPSQATAEAKGFTSATAPGEESFVSNITQFNLNNLTWDTMFEREYSFTSAPVGARFKQLEIHTGDFSQQVGSGEYYHMARNVSQTTPNANFAINETIAGTAQNNIKLCDYESPMEQGAYNCVGDSGGKPARQPTIHVGMRAIDKASPSDNSTRASEFVNATAGFVVTATIEVSLPQYPNRFLKPKYYNVSMENAQAGVVANPVDFDSDSHFITWGLTNDQPPALAADEQPNKRKKRNPPEVTPVN